MQRRQRAPALARPQKRNRDAVSVRVKYERDGASKKGSLRADDGKAVNKWIPVLRLSAHCRQGLSRFCFTVTSFKVVCLKSTHARTDTSSAWFCVVQSAQKSGRKLANQVVVSALFSKNISMERSWCYMNVQRLRVLTGTDLCLQARFRFGFTGSQAATQCY